MRRRRPNTIRSDAQLQSRSPWMECIGIKLISSVVLLLISASLEVVIPNSKDMALKSADAL